MVSSSRKRPEANATDSKPRSKTRRIAPGPGEVPTTSKTREGSTATQEVSPRSRTHRATTASPQTKSQVELQRGDPSQLDATSGAPSANLERARAIARDLLDWYATHRRRLPWRERPSPYSTWISEVMLQQTQVAAVIPYFERWMARFPTVSALADAEPDAVMSAWQGLGYYSRARNLQRSAQYIRDVHGEVLPSKLELLRKLPGIGRYTAGAIASIAFDEPEPAVDGNVMRVLTRLEGLRGDPRCEPLNSELWKLAGTLVHCESPSRFNQALMELGALVCVPEKPRCDQCPILHLCTGRRLGIVDRLPELATRPKPELRRVVVLASRNETGWLLEKRSKDAVHWTGLYAFPSVELEEDETPLAGAKRLLAKHDVHATLGSEQPIARFKYPITRFRFEATAFRAPALRRRDTQCLDARYVGDDELATLAMPAPHRRLYNLISKEGHAR